MRIPKIPFLRRFVKDERGQTAVLITLTMVAMTAMSAMGIETGHIYYAYRLLQASTNAAALAGGQTMPNITQAGTNVTKYSAESGQLNYNSLLQNVSLSTSFYCSANSTALNVQCQTPPSGEGSCTVGTTCNALSVTQHAQVNLWFGGLLGFRTINLSAIATAAMRGGSDQAFNIAVIIDTTRSMQNSAPSSDGCSSQTKDNTQIQCAIYGLQKFLLEMDPCPLNTTCSSSPTYVDDVALFAFPALAAGASNIQKDTACPTSNPTTVPYAFPDVTSDPATSQNLILPTSTPTSNAGTYEVVAFSNSYKTSDGSTTLAPSPNPLAVAAGGSTCQGLQAPGGEATYYAQAIYAAQAALYTMSGGSTPNGSQNIMIILSDGDASACNQYANTSAGGCQGSNDIVALNCPTPGGTGCSKSATAPTNPPLNGTGTATTNPNWSYSGATGGYQSPIYPSALGECGQAVEAAQKATAAGTTVITVAMGAETSGSCSSDAQYTVSDSYTGATYGMLAWNSGNQACTAIEAMASAPRYAVRGAATFYSDATSGCSAPPGTAAYTTIGSIFQAIAGNLSDARLIPKGS